MTRNKKKWREAIAHDVSPVAMFIFSASLIILALLDDSLHPCKTLLSFFSLISLKKGWIRVFSLDEVGNFTGGVWWWWRNDDHHVQRDNNHHFSVRRSLWRESSVCIFWVPAKHKWRTWKKVCHLQVPWLLSTCYIDRRHDLAWTGRISQLTLNHLSRPSSAGFQI